MKRGRKPKPTELRKLEGNLGKRPFNDEEPKPPQGHLHMPPWLDEQGRAEWNRLVPILKHMRVLTDADYITLASLCQQYSIWAEASKALSQSGLLYKSDRSGMFHRSPLLVIINDAITQMNRLATELGLTPSSRSRLKASASASYTHEELEKSLDRVPQIVN